VSDPAGFKDAVKRQASHMHTPVLFAFSDASLLPLITDPLALNNDWRYVAPDPKNLRVAFDKALTVQLARNLKISVPRTHICETVREAAMLCRQLQFPVVLKPRHSVYWPQGGTGVIGKVRYATSRHDFERKLDSMAAETGEVPLIQQLVRGEEVGAEFLCNKGRILAASAHRRLRSLSPCGGAAVLSETVPLSYHGIGAKAERLVNALSWSGPIMVEFKICESTGSPQLMEINGRFWGSLPLAIAAGIDFPLLSYELSSGREPQPKSKHTLGVISRHFLGDAKHLADVLFSRDAMRSVLYPGRLQALKNFVLAPRGRNSDVIDFSDLSPVAREVLDCFSIGIERLKRRAAHTAWNLVPSSRCTE
jgi:predicted ATP-grasp superfamily ATP-dependent carboligase